MLKHLFLFFCVCVLLTTSSAQNKSQPDSLLAARNFFLLNETLNSQGKIISPKDSLYYYSFIHNFFNQSGRSNDCIAELLRSYPKELNTNRKISLLKLCIDNYIKIYDYAAAYDYSQMLLEKHGKDLSKDEKDDTRNSAIIWKSLRHTPPQKVNIATDTRVPYRRDRAGLLTIPVNSDTDTSQHFVFDTGANISVITESNAKKNKLSLLDEYFEVTAITGKKIKARCGVARTMTIGAITMHNVVFMIFPDSALSFGTKYKIEGIIGFPVIEQLAEIRINRNGYLEVPAVPLEVNYNNMGLDELTPIINLRFGELLLPFTFDTGGQQTFLNVSFFKKYQDEIERTGKQEYLNYGGAGGIDSVKSYSLPELQLQIGDEPFRLKNVSVKTVAISPKENIYYGNLGQDAINQYAEVIINFKTMYVELRRKME